MRTYRSNHQNIIMCFITVACIVLTSSWWVPIINQLVYNRVIRNRIKSVLYCKSALHCNYGHQIIFDLRSNNQYIKSIYEAVKNMTDSEFNKYLNDIILDME